MSCNEEETRLYIDQVSISTPFEMPTIKFPDFNNCQRILITDFGAKEGDKERTSLAIKEAVKIANEKGGGVVVVPKGEWLTGMIHLKSNVNLHLEEGATLLFSEKPEDYLPSVYSSWDGIECFNYSPLIYAYDCSNIAITGNGELKAKMEVWNEWSDQISERKNSLEILESMTFHKVPLNNRQMAYETSYLSPQFIQFNRCSNVLVDGVSITNSPFWVIHPYMSKNIVIRNIKVSAKELSNDGIDAEMSQNILIENCVFDIGNEAIAIKAGRNQDEWCVNIPTKNIVVRNCLVENSQQLLAMGSDLAGGVENIYIDSCEVRKEAKLDHLLYIKTNEKKGGYVFNVSLNNIKCDDLSNGILSIDPDKQADEEKSGSVNQESITSISNIFLKNISTTSAQFITKVIAQKQFPVKNIILKNVSSRNISDINYYNENVINFNVID